MDTELVEAKQQPSDSAETSTLDAGDDNDNDSDSDNTMGIKILSVVSLRDKSNAIPGLSPVKSPQPSGSWAHSDDLLSPPGPPSQESSEEQKGGEVSAESSPSKGLKEASVGVDADDMAMRHERMACTYKCQSCSVHSPALSAIVEHLKQHHHDIPLFSCPYCRLKKDVFFTEEQVHGHVIEHHPSNYAKNEVSLSERAKSFVQVLALPSGRNSRGGGLIEQDIYMCLQCESHVPDVDYALKHLRLEHPGLLKYACPACGVFTHSQQEAVRAHMQTQHDLQDAQPSLAMDAVFLRKIASISRGGKYCDHAHHKGSPKPSPKKASPSKPGGVPLLAPSAVPVPVAVDSSLVAAATASQMSPFGLVQVDPTSPLMMSPASGSPRQVASRPGRRGRSPRGASLEKLGAPQMPRPILPVPSPTPDSPKATVSKTMNMTVRQILDKQRAGDGSSSATDTSPSALTVSVTQAQGTPPSAADSPSPRRMFPMTDRLDRLGRSRRSVSPLNSPSSAPSPSSPAAAASSSSSPSRAVLKVPQVSSILNLSSPTRSSADAPVSVGSPSPSTKSQSVPASSLPFSVASLTAPAVTTAPSTQLKTGGKRGSGPGEDPEAFQIFNLKPRALGTAQTPSPRPSNPVTQAMTPRPPALGPPNAVVTMASSALFPQQFRLQQYQPPPPVLQPAGIGTLPIGQGGLPLAQNIAFPLSLPLPVNPTQLLMTPNPLAPLIVPAEILSQLNIAAAPHLPQLQGLPITPALTQQPQGQGQVQGQREQVAAVNLSLGAQSSDKRSPPGSIKMDRPTTAPPRFPGEISRRGRPRLNPISPRAPTPAGDSGPRSLTPRPQVAHSGSPTSGVRVRQGGSHDCMCPYCLVTLRPWEVAQHIKMSHPGQEVKYQRK